MEAQPSLLGWLRGRVEGQLQLALLVREMVSWRGSSVMVTQQCSWYLELLNCTLKYGYSGEFLCILYHE